MKIQIEVFWVVMCCSVTASIFRGGNKVLWNIGILLQHYLVSQLRRPQFEPDL
jgi:hypothetical protein